MNIRRERETDYGKVYELVQMAFAGAEHSDGTEQDLVAALRTGAAFIPSLSLVAEADGVIAGYILFTKAQVGTETVLALAPLAVLPGYQRRGIGSALVKRGHQIAKELGYGYALVLGNPSYYARFGYLPAVQFGIQAPRGIPSEYLMAIRLQRDAKPVSGVLSYASEFGIS